MGPVIRAEHLVFGYAKDVPVLTDVSFEVSAGEVLMILGANGCGKSTLMRVLLAERRLASGAVTLAGDDVAHLPAREIARRVAMVFQDHNAPFPFPVMDVVAMGRTPYLPALGAPGARDREICREALDAVGMRRLAEVPYTQISGGERQLVLIARALAQQTPLIMMDEPTSHLDYRNAATVPSSHPTITRPPATAGAVISSLTSWDHSFCPSSSRSTRSVPLEPATTLSPAITGEVAAPPVCTVHTGSPDSRFRAWMSPPAKPSSSA